MQSFGSCSIMHIHCEGNAVAHILAKTSLDNELGTYRLPDPPAFAIQALLDDIDGRSRPRGRKPKSPNLI